MRVFVYEHLCAGGLGDHFAPSLLAEGWAMLAAVLTDLDQLPWLGTTTLLDDHSELEWKKQSWNRVRVERRKSFSELARRADATLIIAPEFDEILFSLARQVEEAGGRLLGPSSAAIQLTADKLALGEHWLGRAVPTPVCFPWRPGQVIPNIRFPAVCKPRFGAGSQATYLANNHDELQGCAVGSLSSALFQPFVPGTSASVAFLIGPKQVHPLPPAFQILSSDGRFHYQGGRLPLPPDLAARAARLAWQAIEGLPGLQGYVGVDLVLGEAIDGRQDFAIEINPRLTTSYVGLQALANFNLAETMINVMRGEDILPLRWRAGSVSFGLDGRGTYSEKDG